MNNRETSNIEDSPSCVTTQSCLTSQSLNIDENLNKLYKRRNGAFHIHSTQEMIKRLGSKNRKTIRRDRNVSRSLGLLIFSFFICWFPYTVFSLINAICLNQSQNKTSCIDSRLIEISLCLLWIKCAVNPFIYTMYQNSFRVAYKNIFVSIKGKRQETIKN